MSVEPAWCGSAALAAMHAPRGLLVLDNSRIGELCATCQHAATDAAQVLYQALGLGANVGYNGGNPSDPQNHCTFYTATQGSPPDQGHPGPPDQDGRARRTDGAAAGRHRRSHHKWVPWSTTAPTLTNDVSWSSPPVTSQ